ncbi:MAG TPA: nuclear transport factor 2 family protein [Nitrososphaeraceae archaeon]
MNLSSNIEINKQLVRNFAEDVFNRHDLAAVDKYMAAGVGFKKYLGEYFLGHPDSRTTIDHIVAEGDKVFVMFTTTATNKQSGKRVTIKSADVYRIENELLAEHWDVVEATVFPNRKISEL